MKIIFHKVGNKINQEKLTFSDSELQLDENMSNLLMDFFLRSLKSDETYQFNSESYLQNNIVYDQCKSIFSDTNFVEASKIIAKHLYDAAENPRIQSGELFVAYFDEGEISDNAAIGIFKTEKKSTFLKIDTGIEKDYGIYIGNIDKGAIIYNQEQENGYVVSVVDNNKNGDIYYWFEDFLKVKQRQDNYFHTQVTLAVYKDYIAKQLPQEFEVSKADQADFLNKSITFFKEREKFDFEEFTNEVLQDNAVIESFGNFKSDYEQVMQVSISEDFPINESAVKKQQRHFKSIIKLDKNFHIYIHGDRKMIEPGQDEKGRFYKLYFENEN